MHRFESEKNLIKLIVEYVFSGIGFYCDYLSNATKPCFKCYCKITHGYKPTKNARRKPNYVDAVAF